MNGKPKFECGQRVTRAGEEGRVQDGFPADGTFRYIVKWDNGPTTVHVEEELRHVQLPPHYLGKDS
jgi:hypothetical protein